MELIDNEDIHIDNIAYKIQMIIELIEHLRKEREDDFKNEKERNGITKEIQRIQTRLNNYNYKYDIWKSLRDEDLIDSSGVDPVASSLGE